MPICAVLMLIPLPASVIRELTVPTMVTSRPSRIQAVPRPTTTIQWNLVHGSRSRRDGILVRIVPVSTAVSLIGEPPDWLTATNLKYVAERHYWAVYLGIDAVNLAG